MSCTEAQRELPAQAAATDASRIKGALNHELTGWMANGFLC